MGMSRASIYRKVKLFRIAFGAHPDEFEMPGITLDLAAFREGWAAKEKAKAHEVASLRLSVRRLGIVSWVRLRVDPLGRSRCIPMPGKEAAVCTSAGAACRAARPLCGRGRGGSAGAREDPPLLRREPAQPVRDADLQG